MGFSRGLPRMVDARLRHVYAGMRTGLQRQVIVYLAVASADAPDGAGYDDVSGTPFVVDAANPYRTYTYRTIPVPARIRWNSEDAQSQEGMSGTVKMGDVTIYCSTDNSGWIKATMGDENSYLVVDGQQMTATGGPVMEGFGAVLEHSYELTQSSRTGLYGQEDGGVFPKLT